MYLPYWSGHGKDAPNNPANGGCDRFRTSVADRAFITPHNRQE